MTPARTDLRALWALTAHELAHLTFQAEPEDWDELSEYLSERDAYEDFCAAWNEPDDADDADDGLPF